MKKIILILVSLFILLTFSVGCDKQNSNGENISLTSTTAQKIGDITFTVNCKKAVDYGIRDNKDYTDIIPSDGIIYTGSDITIYDGDTAFSVLQRVCKKQSIKLKTSGSYISGIGGLSERDCGSGSGWMFKVNDEFPNKSSSSYKLSKGDKVEFIYTCSIGDTN